MDRIDWELVLIAVLAAISFSRATAGKPWDVWLWRDLLGVL